MANTSVSLGPHWEQFIASQTETGRYGSASEVIRAGLRLLEDHERRLDELRRMLDEGAQSPARRFDPDAIMADIHNDYTHRMAGPNLTDRDVA